ncbi:MAG: D-glycerate dehydrogenase [Candidatus Heimdallarchaeota archaeon]|nr:D-glycerate dehydrogenase [Candidatus Heimdallarchaeota archaeon]
MRVFVTRRIPEPGLEILRENFEVDVFEGDSPISREELIERAKGCDGILPLLTDSIDADIMDKTGIKAIANYAVGIDNIDVFAATKRKISVTNTPGVLTDATADLTFALILAISRRIVESDKYLREGRWKGWDPLLLLGGDFVGKTLGIIGFGRIGKAVAQRAQGFNMNIIYTSRSRYPVEEIKGIKFVSFDELLKTSDYVTIHAPYTEETHHLMSEKELDLMKPTAYLINTSRGKLIDEIQLIKVLQAKKIAGAAFDVFYNEPEINPELIELDNVVLIPHLGSASLETRTKMATIAAENLVAALMGRRPENIVNPEVYD